jgi:hypothetical protein
LALRRSNRESSVKIPTIIDGRMLFQTTPTPYGLRLAFQVGNGQGMPRPLISTTDLASQQLDILVLSRFWEYWAGTPSLQRDLCRVRLAKSPRVPEVQ